ncbi:MAG: aromatic ring-hydroxylating dioxygenase subunit alpha, partial [Frankiaceae bacterium]|nr:aromatic ring-hydroxylating dioxygenase subunit alpha [Frankiaceae bacterium]
PQLVAYAGELPQPGSFATKEVMGQPILLTRARDGRFRAFQNICQHRQAPVAGGCGIAKRLACPYHSWTYDLEGAVVGIPGEEGFPAARADGPRLTELPAEERAGFLWICLTPGAAIDIAAHLGDLDAELASWDIGAWTPIGEKRLDAAIDWKLAIDTFSENYHFATVHTTTFATVAHSNCTVFDSFGRHHRLVFPMRGIEDFAEVPEAEWKPLEKVAVIYAIYPNVVLSVTAVNGEIFRVYPTDRAGHSVTFHQNATSLDVSTDAARQASNDIFEYAHHTVRDEDYALATKIQANLSTGLQPTILFGRNEPGLHHRHAVLAAELEKGRMST